MQSIRELDYQAALDQFEEAESLGENERLILRGKGIAYMGMTRYEDAIGCFEAALAGSNGWVQDMDIDMNYYLAAAYTKNGQFAEAAEIYDHILDWKKGDKDAYLLRGNTRLALADYDGAVADFDASIALDPQNYDRVIDIYEILDEYGYSDAAKGYLQNALDAYGDKMSSYDSGRIYYYLGNYPMAQTTLAGAKDKRGADSYLFLGKAYEATGDYNYAASVYNSYIAQDDTRPDVYNQLGLCEMAKQDYQKALEAFQAGLKIQDNELRQSLAYNEIVAYEYLGDFRKASTLLDNYLTAYPDDEKAKREQIFLKTR
jgi:tetratricopeptide (TPR) repeat protein